MRVWAVAVAMVLTVVVVGLLLHGDHRDKGIEIVELMREEKQISNTLVVQVDTRGFSCNDTLMETATELCSINQITADINRRYACIHGYDYLYVQPMLPTMGKRVERSSVLHRQYGLRSPAWARIPVIHRALMQGYSTILYLDTDAFVRNLSMALPHMIDAISNDGVPWSNLVKSGKDYVKNGTYPLTPSSKASILVSQDWNPTLRRTRGNQANTGVLIIRNTQASKEIMRMWWDSNVDGGRWNRRFMFDQQAFNALALQSAFFRRHVLMVKPRTINARSGRFIQHHTDSRHTANNFRVTVKQHRASNALFYDTAFDVSFQCAPLQTYSRSDNVTEMINKAS